MTLLEKLKQLINSPDAPARGELRPSEDLVHNYYERILQLIDEAEFGRAKDCSCGYTPCICPF